LEKEGGKNRKGADSGLWGRIQKNALGMGAQIRGPRRKHVFLPDVEVKGRGKEAGRAREGVGTERTERKNRGGKRKIPPIEAYPPELGSKSTWGMKGKTLQKGVGRKPKEWAIGCPLVSLVERGKEGEKKKHTQMEKGRRTKLEKKHKDFTFKDQYQQLNGTRAEGNGSFPDPTGETKKGT